MRRRTQIHALGGVTWTRATQSRSSACSWSVLYMAGMGDYMILPVHDEVLFDAPADIIDDLKMEVPEGDVEHGRLRSAVDS